MKKLFTEFKEFAMKGNVVDLGVGIIIGGAFGKIVTSFVNDVLMPPLGLLMGGVDFADKSWVLRAATETKPEIVMHYGSFINSIVDFAIVAFAIFMVIKQINRLKSEPKVVEEKPAEPSEEIKLLAEIRDAIKSYDK